MKVDRTGVRIAVLMDDADASHHGVFATAMTAAINGLDFGLRYPALAQTILDRIRARQPEDVAKASRGITDQLAELWFPGEEIELVNGEELTWPEAATELIVP